MRKSSKLFVAVAAAGLVATGGSAFTTSNSFTNTSNVLGYGENAVSGTTVSDITYTTNTSDAAKLDNVVFTAKTDITGKTAKLTLKDSAGANVGSGTYSCTLGTWDATASTIVVTCATADGPLVSLVSKTGLSVVD
jgi:hypothetical protein